VIESLKEHSVVGAACGKNHTLILTGNGLGFGCLTGMGRVIYEFHMTGLLSRLALFLRVSFLSPGTCLHPVLSLVVKVVIIPCSVLTLSLPAI